MRASPPTLNKTGDKVDPKIGYMRENVISVCAPPQLSGRILFAHPDARAIFLHNDLLCNGTCSITGGAYRTGGHNGKDPHCETKKAFVVKVNSKSDTLMKCINN